MNNSCLVDNTA